tara:strand:+ start:179 stop:1021 length:843 start_codon:yes stop_codon:yes gene_type:complete
MRKRVAYLGPQGTYAEKAAIRLARLESLEDVEFIPCSGLNSAIEQVAKNLCDLAVVPIENSVEGGVTGSLDAMWKFPQLFIKRALVLPIRHALVGNGLISEISEVLSHPQALAQCNGWLHKNLPNALLLPTNSTAEAVKMITGSKFRAAIASRSSCNSNNLQEIAYPINDVAGNRTRFVLIQTQATEQQGNIASLAFSLHSNKPGELLKALSCVAKLGLNMNRIESRPSKRELGEYIFFIDIEIPQDHNNLLPLLRKELNPLCENLVEFGCYESTDMEID